MINHATAANPCSLAIRLAAMIALCDTESRDDMDVTLLQVHRIAQLYAADQSAANRDLAALIDHKFKNGDEPETPADYLNWIEALAIILPPVIVMRG